MPPEEKSTDQKQGSEVAQDEGQKQAGEPNSKGWEAAQQYKAENADLKKRLAKIEADKKAEEEAKLKESGKWQEFATKAEAKSASLEKQLRRERIERAIVSVGGKANEPEDLIPFVDVPDDLDVSDAKALRKHIGDQVKKLTETKPYLFQPADVKTNNTKVATAPAAGDNLDPKKVSKSAMWGLSEQQLQKIREAGR